MYISEIYAWCVALSLCGAAWLIDGFPGVGILITGMIVGNIDVSWLDDLPATKREDQPITPEPPAVEPPPPNVVRMPLRRR